MQIGQTLRGLAAQLNAVSPLAALQRGYAVVTRADSTKIIRNSKESPVGSEVDVQLAKGGRRCQVDRHQD